MVPKLLGVTPHHAAQDLGFHGETKSKSTVFPALILVYTVIVTDQRKRNILLNLEFVNLGFGWGVRREYLSDL